MATTGADVLIDTLIDWGVEVIFGLPGDGIDGIMRVGQAGTAKCQNENRP